MPESRTVHAGLFTRLPRLLRRPCHRSTRPAGHSAAGRSFPSGNPRLSVREGDQVSRSGLFARPPALSAAPSRGSPERVTAPGPRSRAFERISWDEALDLIAERLYSGCPGARSRIDPALLLCRNHRRAGLWLDGSPFLSSPRRVAARSHHLCGDRRPGPQVGLRPQDWEPTRRPSGMPVTSSPGPRISTAMPFICGPSSKKLGATAQNLSSSIHIPTRTARAADWHIPINPGTDTALALGMMRILVGEGLYDRDYVTQWTLGFEALRERITDLHAGARLGVDGDFSGRRGATGPRIRNHDTGGHSLELRCAARREWRSRGTRDLHAAGADRRLETPWRRPAAFHQRRVSRTTRRLSNGPT